MILFDKIDPQFRLLTDFLFFTDRTDVDWSNYQVLLGSNLDHYYYLTDRFNRSIEIFWDEKFWLHRLELLFSLGNDKLTALVQSSIDNRFNKKTRYYDNNIKNNNDYIQYVALCKIKSIRKENLQNARELLLQLATKSQDIVNIVNDFIPSVFPSLAVYGELASAQASKSGSAFYVLQDLSKKGIPVDLQMSFKVAQNLFFKRSFIRKNRNLLFSMLRHDEARDTIKAAYKPEHKTRLLELISHCEFNEFESVYHSNVKSMLDIDVSIADEIMTVYADKLHARGYGAKKSNIVRIIKVLKAFPQMSPRKMLVYLSNNDRMSDIKYLIKAFPELKKLVVFV